MRRLALLLLFAPPLAAAEPVDYLRDVKPILKTRCYACHGALKQQGKLRLDTAATALAGGKHGPAVRPSDAAKSLLFERVTDPDTSSRMPPEGPPLDAKQIALLKTWIEQGAKAPADEKPEVDPRNHWAFQKPARPAVPAVADPAWQRNPVDAFLFTELARHNLAPSPPADRATLLRRVYLDLVG